MWQVNSGETTNTTSKFEAENNFPPKKIDELKNPKIDPANRMLGAIRCLYLHLFQIKYLPSEDLG